MPPLRIGAPVPSDSPTNRFATPVRLSCPIVAIVPWRIGVMLESEMSSSTSASPLLVSVIPPTEPT